MIRKINMLNESDIQIDVYSNSSPIKQVRLMHLPTGKSVSGSGKILFLLQAKLLIKLAKELKVEC
jgi:hypothetical protein